MRLNINGLEVKLLGDTHLGRKFRNHVPLHRIGHREAMVWDQFVRELDPEGATIHIHMGDIFDAPVVDLGIILDAATAYKDAALLWPGTRFYVLRGNHDASRDLDDTSAFDIFAALVQDHVTVVRDVAVDSGLLMCGWDPVQSAEEILSAVSAQNLTAAFGHYDVDLRSPPFNLIPTATLAKLGVTRAFTGHIHLPDEFKRDGIDVTVVGSMQPYSFAEDASGDWYVTTNLDSLREEDPDGLRNMNIRVRLKPGEVFDLDIDCLQLKVERVDQEVELADIEVKLGDFSLQSIFEEELGKRDIPDPIVEEVKTRWSATFT